MTQVMINNTYDKFSSKKVLIVIELVLVRPCEPHINKVQKE